MTTRYPHTALACALALAACAAPAIVWAQQRLPTIAPADYSAEQKQAVADFEAARKAPISGPFQPLLHSPQVMTVARSMGDYLRYKSAIGNTLSELVILITAREWTQDYEWHVHYPIALKAGIQASVADAIAAGRRPPGMSDDEETVYEFATELQRNKRVADATYARAEKRFGKQGVIDLTGVIGYYTLLAMEMNMAQYEPPQGTKRLERFPK
jgi:4-carboxymuconolactone decarboxylase